MTDKKSPSKESPDDGPKDGRKAAAPQSNRETVESIVVAVMLAFLFRTFVAEAFVIPTGSMAPTLMGNHKDVTCSKCGHAYQGSASCENDDRQAGNDWGTAVATTCPLCRFTMTLDWNEDANQGTFTGDRILVSKFSYDLSEPERWDVIVFKFPGNGKVNYIKRLIGLPNETIKLKYGDVFIRKDGESAFRIARKPPHKQIAMMQLVDDISQTAAIADLHKVSWPSRWQFLPDSDGLRLLESDLQGVEVDGRADERWLRYRHVVPDGPTWAAIERAAQGGNDFGLPSEFAGELISDFGAYNAVPKIPSVLPSSFRVDPTARYQPEPSQLGKNWVGDLAVEADLIVADKQGQLILDLVEGGVHFFCTIELATGKATLSTSSEQTAFDDGEPTADTAIRGPGKYAVRYSNFDDEIRLWVNDDLVQFAKPTTYAGTPDRVVVPGWSPDDPGDLQPIGIGARGARVTAHGMRVLRDIYYIASTSAYESDYDHFAGIDQSIPVVFRNPATWKTDRLFRARHERDFPLGPDQYFPMGDNSAHSADARGWTEKYVERDLLIGKAAVVYWPHSWNRPLPLLPNVKKMRLIH